MDLMVIYIEVIAESMDVDEFTEEQILKKKLPEGREQNLKEYTKVTGSSLKVEMIRRNYKCYVIHGMDPQSKLYEKNLGKSFIYNQTCLENWWALLT